MKNIKLFNEYVNEAYDGKISDFKYDLEMALEEIGISSKAIKRVSKVGKKFEVRMSSYMSQRSTWEKIGELMGATLVDFKADPKSINVGLYESFEVWEKADPDMSKFKVGQKIKWSSPKGPKEDEIEKVDGIYLKLKSGGTIPYQSVIAEGVQYATYATPKGTMGRYRLQSDEVDVVKALNLSGFKYGRAFGDEVGFETSSDRNQFIKILDKMHKEDKLSESVVNEAKTSLDDMMKWIENSMKFVRTSEEFDGNDGGIWVSGENGDQYKGKRIYDYYSEDPKNYELGVLKDWEKELNKRGWYSEWYDAGTVMIWPD
jgi:hypothetical protein